jgi:prevent-host-death family protein
MRSASIRDLHIHTSELVREAAEGSVIVIEKRGEPIAELRPLTGKQRPPFPDFKAIRARMPRMDVDSTDLISEDRDR